MVYGAVCSEKASCYSNGSDSRIAAAEIAVSYAPGGVNVYGSFASLSLTGNLDRSGLSVFIFNFISPSYMVP